MEKAKGTALGDVWYQLPTPSKHKFIRQVVELGARLASVPFTAHAASIMLKMYPESVPRISCRFMAMT